MKIFVLGHRGMLGHMLVRYCESQEIDVVTSNERYDGDKKSALLEAVQTSGCDWVINTIAAIPQKNSDERLFFEMNAVFPQRLKSSLKPEQKLIHASTDSVFKGDRGSYRVDESPNADDGYGSSKGKGEAIAEKNRVWIIRTSILGPELKSCHGLLNWFLDQKRPITGFTNQFWNGITTLQWAKLACEIMRKPLAFSPIVQPGTKPVSKYDLLKLMAKVYQKKVDIIPGETKTSVDRSLIPSITTPSLEDQLRELRAFSPWQKIAA